MVFRAASGEARIGLAPGLFRPARSPEWRSAPLSTR